MSADEDSHAFLLRAYELGVHPITNAQQIWSLRAYKSDRFLRECYERGLCDHYEATQLYAWLQGQPAPPPPEAA